MVFVAMHWDIHIGARHSRPGLTPLLAARTLRGGKARLTRDDGRPMQTIGEQRVEYGQGVLVDAARDLILTGCRTSTSTSSPLRQPGDGDEPFPLG